MRYINDCGPFTEGSHRFLAEVGSAAGAEILASFGHRRASAEDEAAAEAVIARTRASMGREMEAEGVNQPPRIC